MTDWMLGPINEQLGCKADGVLVVCTHWETMEGHFTLPTVGGVTDPKQSNSLASEHPGLSSALGLSVTSLNSGHLLYNVGVLTQVAQW